MIRKLASETVIYGGTTILVRLISYALAPLHVSVFQPENYGIISEFYAYAIAANVLYTYGMETAFFRFSTKKNADMHYYFNTVQSSLLSTGFVFSLTLYLFAENIAIVLGYPNGAVFVEWFAILFAVDAFVALPFARLRLMHKPIRFASIKIINGLLILLLNLFFLYFCRHIYEESYLVSLKPLIASFYNPDLGLGYIFFANLMANILLIPLHYDAFLKLKFGFKLSVLKQLYAYGIPIMFSGLAFAINEAADRIFLKYWLPEDFYQGKPNQWAVGVYSACYKLSIFITMAIQAFKYAAEPFFFAQAEKKNPQKTYAITLKYFIIFCCVIIVFVVANLHFLSILIIPNNSYWVGLDIVPLLLFANLFLGIYYNLSIWFKITDKTKYGAYMSAFGAFITITINFLFIPVLGYFGSAIATLTCYFSMAAISYILGQKNYRINYDLSSAIKNMLFVGGIVIVIHFIDEPIFFREILYKNLVASSYLVLIFVLETKKIKAFFEKYKS